MIKTREAHARAFQKRRGFRRRRRRSPRRLASTRISQSNRGRENLLAALVESRRGSQFRDGRIECQSRKLVGHLAQSEDHSKLGHHLEPNGLRRTTSPLTSRPLSSSATWAAPLKETHGFPFNGLEPGKGGISAGGKWGRFGWGKKAAFRLGEKAAFVCVYRPHAEKGAFRQLEN